MSVQWGPWATVGMAAGSAVHGRLEASGFGLIGLSDGLAALDVAVGKQSQAVLGVMPVQWEVVLRGVLRVPSFLSMVAPQPAMRMMEDSAGLGDNVASASSGPNLETVLAMVRRTAGGTVDADAPLMEAGVDSLGSIELRNQLQAVAGRGVAEYLSV